MLKGNVILVRDNLEKVVMGVIIDITAYMDKGYYDIFAENFKRISGLTPYEAYKAYASTIEFFEPVPNTTIYFVREWFTGCDGSIVFIFGIPKDRSYEYFYPHHLVCALPQVTVKQLLKSAIEVAGILDGKQRREGILSYLENALLAVLEDHTFFLSIPF